MKITMPHHEAREIVQNEGLDEFFAYLDRTYKQLGLYQISTDWIDNAKYICKCKGEHGDLLIIWDEVKR